MSGNDPLERDTGWMTPPDLWTREDALVRIRPICRADADAHCAAVNESWRELEPWLDWAHEDYQLEESLMWIGQACTSEDPRELAFAMQERASGQFAGIVGVNDLRPSCQTANIGYWARTPLAGRGLTSAAIVLLARCVFERLGLARLEIMMEPGNKASRRVAEKAGAAYEGKLRSRVTIHDERRDVLLYSLLPRDLH